MSAIGIDPGIGGALAHFENDGLIDVIDMPTFPMVINKKTRQRLDTVELNEYFALKKMMGVRIVILEAVGGRPKQSASGAFVFGYTVGVLFAMCIAHKLPIQTVPSAVWKKQMQVPGKKLPKSDKMDPRYASKIITRADELIPEHREKWRGPRGGFMVDRAEAALLGLYGVRYALRVPSAGQPPGPAEFSMVYKHADTGA